MYAGTTINDGACFVHGADPHRWHGTDPPGRGFSPARQAWPRSGHELSAPAGDEVPGEQRTVPVPLVAPVGDPPEADRRAENAVEDLGPEGADVQQSGDPGNRDP